MDIPVYQYDMLDSTNTQCRRLAAEGVMDAVVTADCQTAALGVCGVQHIILVYRDVHGSASFFP